MNRLARIGREWRQDRSWRQTLLSGESGDRGPHRRQVARNFVRAV